MTTTIELHPVIKAEREFIEAREAAFTNIAATAKAAIDYGKLMLAMREELKSDKEFTKRMLELGSSTPPHETQNIMKLAARATNEGAALWNDKQKMLWAQDQMGLLPPPANPEPSPSRPPTPADAIKLIANAAQALAKVLDAVPAASWSDEERELYAREESKLRL